MNPVKKEGGYWSSIWRGTAVALASLSISMGVEINEQEQDSMPLKPEQKVEENYESEEVDNYVFPEVLSPSNGEELEEQKNTENESYDEVLYQKPESYRLMEEKLGDELIYDRDKLFKEINKRLEGREYTSRERFSGSNSEVYSEDFDREKAQKMDLMALNQLLLGIDWIENHRERIRKIAIAELENREMYVEGVDENGKEGTFIYPFHRAEAGGVFKHVKDNSNGETGSELEMDVYHPRLPQMKKINNHLFDTDSGRLLFSPKSIREFENSVYRPSKSFKEDSHLMTWHSHITGSEDGEKFADPSRLDLEFAGRIEENGWLKTLVSSGSDSFTLNFVFYTMNGNVVDTVDMEFEYDSGSDLRKKEKDNE